MNCQEVVQQIIAQPGRPAPAPEVERHLWGCPACSQVYLEQQALWRQMDAWEAPEVSAGFDRRLFARAGRRLASPWLGLEGFRRLFRPLQPALPAALACVLVVATLVVQKERYLPAPPDATVAAQGPERDDLRQIDVALDDIQMLTDFDILPVAPAEAGRS